MAALNDKVQDALGELRMLVLGLQVLIGFGYRAVLEPGFDRLPRWLQLTKLASLSLLLAALALVITPAANHRICERGEDTPAFHRLTTLFATLVLLPFAAALALELMIPTSRAIGGPATLIVPLSIASAAFMMWYGIELVAGRRSPAPVEDTDKPAETKDKIRHVLTEARVVLPGAQALLGFQLASTLSERFDHLPRELKLIHLASLSAVALATILLITPAAWHSVVERGELTEGFHRFASRVLLVALIPLAIGLEGDFYVVAATITGSPSFSGWLVGAYALLFFALWFGVGFARRHLGRSASPTPQRSQAPA
jgi:hypothetical protein